MDPWVPTPQEGSGPPPRYPQTPEYGQPGAPGSYGQQQPPGNQEYDQPPPPHGDPGYPAYPGYQQPPPYQQSPSYPQPSPPPPGYGYGQPPPGSYGYGQPPGYWPSSEPPWKGATLGRPASGPGSLAEPWRRLVGRILDGLIALPAVVVVIGGAILIAAPNFGPIFPSTNDSSTSTGTPGFVWLELTIFVASIVLAAVLLFYEAFCTVHWGRTPGKAIMHIRPLKSDGRPLGWGAALGREGLYRLALALGVVGLLDPLWCLWDEKRQCVHDKAVSTIVVQD